MFTARASPAMEMAPIINCNTQKGVLGSIFAIFHPWELEFTWLLPFWHETEGKALFIL